MKLISSENIKNIPRSSGIYIFKNKKENIIYIGKAKDLYKRVRSYFQKQHENLKILELIKEQNSIDYILTSTEHEALLLEAQLIQKFQPKYNTLLKSGTPFMYLEITGDKLLLSNRKPEKPSSIVFGPFLLRSKIRSVYNYLIKTFKLKLCNKKIDNGCLDFHLGICAGSCKQDFDLPAYKIRLKVVKELLNNNLEECKKLLTTQIKKYNYNLEFEKSKLLSNYLQDFDFICETLKLKFCEDKYKTEIIFKTSSKDQLRSILEAQNEIKSILNMKKSPITIDCFDISHFQSSYIVGSCVRFTYAIPDKNKFRRFRIKSLITQNDYEALQEIVKRRYKKSEDLPDLIIIDGGKGQLNAIKHLVHGTKCISLAKKEETIFFDNNNTELKLDIKTESAKLIIALRDYAHHFAINYHKKLRHSNFLEKN